MRAGDRLTGQNGWTGAKGPAGTAGAQGPQGEDSAQGPQGELGPEGPAGATGPMGGAPVPSVRRRSSRVLETSALAELEMPLRPSSRRFMVSDSAS